MADAKFSAMDDSVTIIDEMIGLTVPVSGSYLDEVKDNVQNVNYIKSFLSTSTNTSGDTDVTGDSRESITQITTATLNGTVTNSTSITISATNNAILKGHILTCTGYTSEYADTNVNVVAINGTTITLNTAVSIANGVTLTFKTNKYYKAVNEGTYFVSSGTFNSTTGELTSTSSVISSTLSVGGTSKLTGALTTVAGITNTGGEILVSGGNVQLNDSILLTLGTDDDISMYHDGTDGYITNSTGALKLATETSGIAVTIGHSTSEVTIGDNMTVTGDATVTGDLTVSGGKITLTNGSIIDSETSNILKLTEDLVECSGDLKVGGNDIKASDGTTAITMSGANITFGGTATFPGTYNPSADLHAATKKYVDSVASGLDIKESVRCATVSTMTIGSGNSQWAYSSGTLTYGSNGASSTHASLFDGVTLASTNRVLVKNASNDDANGIYTCTTVGDGSNATVLTRATDHNATSSTGNISAGNFVFIESGSTLANTGFVLQKGAQWTNSWPNAISGTGIAANAITWTQFSSSGSGSSSSAADDITTGDAAVTINTSSGAIGIGTNTTASNDINIGTGAVARTITMGNVTGATTLALNSGTGGIALASTGAGDITIDSDDTLLLDADGVLELNSSAGAIGIGNDADAQAINIGTGAAAELLQWVMLPVQQL